MASAATTPSPSEEAKAEVTGANDTLQTPAEWVMICAGAGSSSSTPKLQCKLSGRKDCVCNKVPVDPRNIRGNPSLILSRREVGEAGKKEDPEAYRNILVDVGKTFREAVMRVFVPHRVNHIDHLIITHPHFDAVGGLDEFREVQRRTVVPGVFFKDGKPMKDNVPTDVFMDADTTESVSKQFPYLFPNPDYERKAHKKKAVTHTKMAGNEKLYVAKLSNYIMEPFVAFLVEDMEVIPIPLHHGNVISNGFVFRADRGRAKTQTVYFSDFRCQASGKSEKVGLQLPQVVDADIERLSFLVDADKTLPILQRCDVKHMILEFLHAEFTYLSHSSLGETIRIIQELDKKGVKADHVWMTGMSCSNDYSTVNAALQKTFGSDRVQCMFDGLKAKL